MNFRRKIGLILGLAIGAETWDRAFAESSRAGRLDDRVKNEILLEICKYIDVHENTSIQPIKK